MDYKLSYPIKTDDEKEKTTLKIRDRIKGADLMAMDEVAGDTAKVLRLIARMSGLSPAEAEQLDAVDIDKLTEIIAKKRKG